MLINTLIKKCDLQNANNILLTPRQRCEAKELLLKSKSTQLPDDTDLNDLWNVLEKKKDASVDEKEWFITYPKFLEAKQEVCSKVSFESKASLLHNCAQEMLPSYEHTLGVKSEDLFNVTRIQQNELFTSQFLLAQSLTQLFQLKPLEGNDERAVIESCVDSGGAIRRQECDYENRAIVVADGKLCEIGRKSSNENALDKYGIGSFNSGFAVSEVDEEYKPFYISFVVRTFLFFLDPLCADHIRILDVLASGLIEPLLQLADTPLTQAQLEENPLTIQRVMIAYTNFLLLDTDRSGMLSREESNRHLRQPESSVVTDSSHSPTAFLDGVFQSCLTYGGEMDFRVYLDLVLSIENRKLPQSIAFFFRIVDSGEQGRLCVKSVKYLVKSLFQLLPDEPDARTLRDVVDEIFDMQVAETRLLFIPHF
ncbi:unnamed protein product [Rodentolepis nana]|uniref:Serine/threonine-protein phosphatase 2A regulatory subunit B'' subunit gamma n=1 Tax=Rodentolepis nana TaxID=102285 RepID=A0A0R3TTU4_RODNA|nr:unnamed protein product [Rodentolepis nana]